MARWPADSVQQNGATCQLFVDVAFGFGLAYSNVGLFLSGFKGEEFCAFRSTALRRFEV